LIQNELAILNYFFSTKNLRLDKDDTLHQTSSISSANILLLVMRLLVLKRENYSEARKKKEKKTNTNPRPLGHLGLPQMRWWNWTIFCLNNQKRRKSKRDD
jgi:hypothetical protein